MPKATKKQTGDKKEKKVKDPNAPKRPISAYFAFAADKREQIKKENPGFKVTDISKRTGELWKDLTEAEKKPCKYRSSTWSHSSCSLFLPVCISKTNSHSAF